MAYKLNTKALNNDTVCWFCKKQPADAESGHIVELHRVLHRKKTLGFGYRKYEQLYEKISILVPRCVSCNKIHEITRWILLSIFISINIAGLFWAYHKYGIQTEDVVALLIAIFLTIWIVFVVSLILILPFILISNLYWKSENKEKQYPQVSALLKQNWKIGSKPTSVFIYEK